MEMAEMAIFSLIGWILDNRLSYSVGWPLLQFGVEEQISKNPHVVFDE